MLKIITTVAALTILALGDGSLLQTGQIKSYDADGDVVTDGSIKDDGYYRAGMVRSYSRSAAGVVTDNVTGLEWQDDVDSVQKLWLTQINTDKCLGHNGETQDTAKCYDTSDDTAATYCSNLSLDNGGWQLPTYKELESLANYGSYSPSVTKGVFQHIFLNGWFWSSITYTGIKNYLSAWYVGLGSGYSSFASKNRVASVRCVRNRQLSPSKLSRNNETEIVTDSITELQWQDNDDAGHMEKAWIEAIDYCEELPLGGGGWRLPNKKELLSIVDHSHYYPALDTDVFQNYSLQEYCSSTTSLVGTLSGTWVVDFRTGTSINIHKNYAKHIRCVRGGQTNIATPVNSSIIMYLLN